MEENIKVFEVRREVTRCVAEKKDNIIFEYIDGEWLYHAPSAQNHTEEQLEIILNKIKELNKKNE